MGSAIALAVGALFAIATAGLADDEPVDLELVIAVDISASMDREEFLIQRAGYVAAIRDRAFVEAILAGYHRRIALTYVEWSGQQTQKIVMPWRLIDSVESAGAFADDVAARPFTADRGTSISTGLLFSATLFQANHYTAPRQVIDVSGDGPNNYGPPVTLARDFVVEQGIVVNGLPILIRPSPIFPAMDRYYTDCVIGGDGAFVQPVRNVAEFPTAIRRKLIQELRVARWQEGANAILASSTEPVDCLIGERMRQHYTGRFYPELD